MFPDTGKYSRDAYKKHVEFMNMGSKFKERAFIAGNRCHHGDSLVLMASGDYKAIKEVKLGDRVLVFDKETKNLVESEVINTYQGEDELFEYTTRIGTIRCTPDHQFLVRSRRDVIKTKPISDCKPGDKLLVPTKWEKQSPDYLSPNICFLIGLLLGDGYLGAREDQFKLTNSNFKLIQRAKSIYEEELGGRGRISVTGDNYYDLYFPKIHQSNKKSPLSLLLSSLELKGTTSKSKFIPKGILHSSEECVRHLLHGLLAADGNSAEGRVSLYTTSPRLRDDFKVACLRLGITTSYHTKLHKNPNHADCYVVQISGNRNLRRLGEIPYKPTKLWNSKRTLKRDKGYSIVSSKSLGKQSIYCLTVAHKDHLFICDNFISGNCGKTEAGGYELTCHLTGEYPDWWEGRRFNKPINAWVVGLTAGQLRESIQETLFGNFADIGSGMIPREKLTDPNTGEIQKWNMPGVPNAIGQCRVRHISGGWSKVEFKMCEQGWTKFQGAKRDLIWFDEEPADFKIYSECLTRTAGEEGEEGILMCTFTPLLGFSEVVLGFMPGGIIPEGGINPENTNRFIISANWEDVPHLSQEWKENTLKSYSPRERDSRSKGIPTAGAGLIYNMPEEYLVVDPFKIPSHWPRCYGWDFGWNTTAGVWIAKDPDSNVYYCYSEHYQGKTQPDEHVRAIKARGEWLIGGADPSGGGTNAADGSRLIDQYIALGAKLTPADNSIISGITRINVLMEAGRFKIFSTLVNTLKELRVYMWDEDTGLPKRGQADHAMDALKYGMAMFEEIARVAPEDDWVERIKKQKKKVKTGRSRITGY